MKDFVLALVGTVGIAALAMSMNNETKQVREDFITGFPTRSKVQKTVRDSYGGLAAIPVDQVARIKCGKSGSAPTPAPKTVEHYVSERIVGNGLGARDNTNMPFIQTSPHLNQTVNKPSPSLNLPSLIRYNAPSLSNMGVTEDFQCNNSVRENYAPKCNKAVTFTGELGNE